MHFRSLVSLASLALAASLAACQKAPAPVVPNVEPAEEAAERVTRLWWQLAPLHHEVSRREFHERVTVTGKPTLLNTREQCVTYLAKVDWVFVEGSDCFEVLGGRARSFRFGAKIVPNQKLLVRDRADLEQRLDAAGLGVEKSEVASKVTAAKGRLVVSSGLELLFERGAVFSLVTGKSGQMQGCFDPLDAGPASVQRGDR